MAVASLLLSQKHTSAAASASTEHEDEIVFLKCFLISPSLPWEHITYDLLFKVRSPENYDNLQSENLLLWKQLFWSPQLYWWILPLFFFVHFSSVKWSRSNHQPKFCMGIRQYTCEHRPSHDLNIFHQHACGELGGVKGHHPSWILTVKSHSCIASHSHLVCHSLSVHVFVPPNPVLRPFFNCLVFFYSINFDLSTLFFLVWVWEYCALFWWKNIRLCF